MKNLSKKAAVAKAMASQRGRFMISNPSSILCNRLHRHSRCKKLRLREFCSGTDNYCPSRDGFRDEVDFVGEFNLSNCPKKMKTPHFAY